MQFNIGIAGCTAAELAVFRRDWLRPPTGEVILASLQRMDPVITARDPASGTLAGFACGFTDYRLIAYLWDLAVLPAYREQRLEGILIERFVAACGAVYQINAHPNLEHAVFFEAAGFTSYPARHAIPMTIQDYTRQAG